MAKQTLRVTGMTCSGCERRIEAALRKTEGVSAAKADVNRGRVEVTYDAGVVRLEDLTAVIESLGYGTKGRRMVAVVAVAALLVAWIVADRLGLLTVFANFPRAEQGVGYAMLLLIGLMTSVHCVAMCGGIGLSQTMGKGQAATDERGGSRAALVSALGYNAGRVVSYTVVGTVVGAVGAVISLSPGGQGLITLLAGVFMIVMGLNLLGVVPGLGRLTPRLPRAFGRIAARGAGKGPVVVGLLNGLMPCGPLQAMQLYALGTGSALRGGLSMFLFALGTVPLMLAVSAAGGLLTRGAARRLMTVGAVLVLLMGLGSVQNGLGLAGIGGGAAGGDAVAAESGESVQQVEAAVSPRGGYPAITVEAGTPVEWNLVVDEGTLTGCNYSLVIPEYDLSVQLDYGDNLITFTPEEPGTYTYTCWMGMIRSTITVTEPG